MQKLLRMMAVLLVASFVLIGCGGQSGTTGGEAAPAVEEPAGDAAPAEEIAPSDEITSTDEITPTDAMTE